MNIRQRIASMAVTVVNRASRMAGRGSGTVVGGKFGLAIDATLLTGLSERRNTVLVSGTNGKTTTTALLAAALGTAGSVASNDTGSNMPAGHVAALAARRDAALVALEVDEAYLGQTVESTKPIGIILLNLSRDQLDRLNEVRKLAERWKIALADVSCVIVANADDPLVVYATRACANTVFVEAGLVWSQDAVGCPNCGGRIVFADTWSCDRCDLEQPPARWKRKGFQIMAGGELQGEIHLTIPGSFNVDNALLVVAMAEVMGLNIAEVLTALARVGTVAGRFERCQIAGADTELMLAKNPAGWAALLDLVAEDSNPVVIGINARIADGADPSWLWDVDFSKLANRQVVATGDRWRDLSVRLDYADIAHGCEPNVERAIETAGIQGQLVSAMGNYTAFGDMRKLIQ
jgi:lipid II isoglutaminyl synthase (glutamine-hydrolysing)